MRTTYFISDGLPRLAIESVGRYERIGNVGKLKRYRNYANDANKFELATHNHSIGLLKEASRQN
jgi:hypothetical protein